MPVVIHNWSELTSEAQIRLLERPAVADDDRIRGDAERIVSEVCSEGDQALRRLTKQHDGADISRLQVSKDEFEMARSQLTQEQLDAIDLAIDNVRQFHTAQLPSTLRVETMPGVVCERYSQPQDAAGQYVPAGTAP